MTFRRLLLFAALIGGTCSAGDIHFPGGTLTIPGISSTGTSFVFSGTLTQANTIDFTETGDPCLQAGPRYCTNGAGIVVVAGTTAVGGTSTFSSTNFGSLLMTISAVGTVQVFPATAGNGLGSGSPPLSLILPTTTLSSLGFGSFSVSNPTITFTVADTNYTDNSGQFVLNQGQPNGVPIPGTSLLIVTGLFTLAAFQWWRTRERAGPIG